MPFDPYQLAVVFWDDDVVDLIGCPQDVESHSGGVVRGKVGVRVQGDGCDDVGVHPVVRIRQGDASSGGAAARVVRGRRVAEPDDAYAQAVYDVRVGLPPGGAASPCANPQVVILQEHGEGQVLVGQGGHGGAQRPSGELVVEGGLRGGHAVVLAVVGEVGYGLHHQLISAGNHGAVIHPGSLRHHHADILAAEVALDGLDAVPARGADDGGHGAGGLNAAVRAAGLYLQAGPVLVLQLADLAEVEDGACLGLVGEVHGGGDGGAALRVDDGDAHAVIAGCPFVLVSALPHAAAPCVHVAVPGGMGRGGEAEQQGKGEEKGC